MTAGRIFKLLCVSACAAAVIGAAPALAGETPPASPPAAVAALPVKQMFGVETPMRDGTKLSSDIWLPDDGATHPVILVRTPYLKAAAEMRTAEAGTYFARHGYAYVIQDVRGRGDSGGQFGFFAQEGHDGYDAIEWLAAQPWSNGRVCTMGISYLGTVQWLAAREKPPHLVCMAPTSPAADYLGEVRSIGGAFSMLQALSWINETSGHISQGANFPYAKMDQIFAHRPLLTMDEAMGRKMPLYRDFLLHDTLDDYWKQVQFTAADFAKIDIPVMVTTGWFDADQTGALFNWRGMHDRPAGARDEFLTIGPWTHVQSYLGGAAKLGEIDLPKEATVDNWAMHLAFYDHYLKQDGAPFDRPKVRVFITGANAWKDFDAYPVPARQTRLYLGGSGHANTATGDGVLSWSLSAGPADAYAYDPKNPVPLDVFGGMFATDRAKEQARQDVLVYTSPVLDKTLEIIGPVAVELYAASDARDTDFTAAISDVRPDGKAVLLGARPVGIIRARYRGGPSAQPSLLTPGKAELYRISLGDIGHAFLPGHRIRIEISSSAYPLFNPNQNTGNPIATDTEWRIARQTILHDRAHPSALVLPVSE